MARPFWSAGREGEPAPEGALAPLAGTLRVTVEAQRRPGVWRLAAEGIDPFGCRFLTRVSLEEGLVAVDRPGLPTRVVSVEDLTRAILWAVPEEEEGEGP